MDLSGDKPTEYSYLELFRRINYVMTKYNFPNICFKPKQIQCLEYLVLRNDVIGIFPTGFGKSILFQLLPDLSSISTHQEGNGNIVLVVCPLNSLIDDQVTYLRTLNFPCGVLRLEEKSKGKGAVEHPFSNDGNESTEDNDDEEDGSIAEEESDIVCSADVLAGKCKLLFGHPEAFLCANGRKLLRSTAYQNSVVTYVIDEAHCVQTW